MKTFKDTAGRTWTVAINVATVRRVKDLLGEDLLSAVGGDLVDRLSVDPVLLCNIIYVVCKEEADAKSISDEDFGKAMAGDAIEQATTAFLEDLADFFPGRRGRLLKKALDKLNALQERAFDVAETKIDGPEVEERFQAALKDSGVLSGSSPAPSESTPTP